MGKVSKVDYSSKIFLHKHTVHTREGYQILSKHSRAGGLSIGHLGAHRVLVSQRRTRSCPGASGCVSVYTARPSPKRATSNRVFVIRADKEGGSQRVLRLRMHRTSAHRKRYSTRVRGYGFTTHSEHRRRSWCDKGVTFTIYDVYTRTDCII